MNLFNRVLVSLLCLTLIAAMIGITVLAWSAPEQSIDALRDAADWLEDRNQDLEKSFLTAGAVLLGLLALIILGLELVPSRPSEVSVKDVKTGHAVLSTAAIGQRLEEAVNRVEHVSDARVVVKARRKGVQVGMDLHVDPEANLATVTDEAVEAVRDVLNNRVHVALAEPPRARVFYRELRFRRPVRPAGAVLPAPTTTPRDGAGEPRPAGVAAEETPAYEPASRTDPGQGSERAAPAEEQPAWQNEEAAQRRAEER